MDYYLIDYENVGTSGLKKVVDLAKKEDIISIFYSENCKYIALDTIESIIEKGIKFCCYQVTTGTSNALDFQLSSFLGYLISKEGSKIKYRIVSNDKGFDCVCDFWKKQSKAVERIGTQTSTEKEKLVETTSNQTSSKKKSSVASNDLATLEEIKKVLSKKDAPEVVLDIFNTYKTKQAICNGISKHFKDSNKTGNVYKKLKPLMKAKNKT